MIIRCSDLYDMPPLCDMLKVILDLAPSSPGRWDPDRTSFPPAGPRSEHAAGPDVSSNSSGSPRRHGAAGCTNVRIYATLPHLMDPDHDQVALSVAPVPNDGPNFLRPARLEDQHRQRGFPLLLARHLSQWFRCWSQLCYHQDAHRRRVPRHRARRDCCVLRAHRPYLHNRPYRLPRRCLGLRS
jgi:hypothetical protein